MNRHGGHPPRDFKSLASSNSATQASFFCIVAREFYNYMVWIDLSICSATGLLLILLTSMGRPSDPTLSYPILRAPIAYLCTRDIGDLRFQIENWNSAISNPQSRGEGPRLGNQYRIKSSRGYLDRPLFLRLRGREIRNLTGYPLSLSLFVSTSSQNSR